MALEIEERLPSVRLYFSKKFLVIKRDHKHLSKIPFLSGINFSFDHKVKAVHESNETQSSLIEEYQVHYIVCCNAELVHVSLKHGSNACIVFSYVLCFSCNLCL